MRLNFNLQDAKPYNSQSSKLPDGDYAVKIVGEEQTEKALVFSYQVLEGNFRGSIVKDWINLNHEKETAREIAQRRIKSIVQAVGLEQLNDTRELFGRPFVVAITTRTWTGNDGTTREMNSIEGYRAATPSTPTPSDSYPAQPQQQAQRQAPAGPFWN